MISTLNVPPATKAVLSCELVLSLIPSACSWLFGFSSIEDHSGIWPLIILIPAKSYFYIWTFLTSALVERNVLLFIVSFSTILVGGKYLERAWSSKELLLFSFLCATLPNVILFVYRTLKFLLLNDKVAAFDPIAGISALFVSFLVAFKQALPDHSVFLFRTVEIKIKQIPFVWIIFVTILKFFNPRINLSLNILGLGVSWTYLRFFKDSCPDLTSRVPVHLKGDPSEAFDFETFFPDKLQSLIRPVVKRLTKIFILLKLYPLKSGASNAVIQEQPANTNTARLEAERRRALAIQVIDRSMNPEGKEQGHISVQV